MNDSRDPLIEKFKNNDIENYNNIYSSCLNFIIHKQFNKFKINYYNDSNFIYYFIRINILSWYAIILFLIYIGRMIVMFSYFVSLTSNDFISTKRKIHFIVIIHIIFIKIYTQKLILMFSSSQINNLYLSKNVITLLLITIVLLLIIVIVILKNLKNNEPLHGFN